MCTCLTAALPHDNEALLESAHSLVWLRAQTMQHTSKATYASGLAHFAHWATQVTHLNIGDVLPSCPEEGVVPQRVELFIAWAAK